MALPIRTTLEDIKEICEYLETKPTGATMKEARSVLDSRRLDGRKLTALKFWGLLSETDDSKLKLTPSGREFAKGGAWSESVCESILRNIPPYIAIIERAAHRKEESLTSTEIAAHWHDHFQNEVGESDRIINDQALCFFHIISGADLGEIVAGRKGNATRIQFKLENVQAFIRGSISGTTRQLATNPPKSGAKSNIPKAITPPSQVDNDTLSNNDAIAQSASSDFLQRGLTVDCYSLIDRLGSGFSAEVWSASVQKVPPGVDLHQGQKVAIKFYSANALAIPDQVIRIEREYRVAQRLRHPHLIRIYEFVLASPRPNHNFLVMDIAPGHSLSSLIGSEKIEAPDALKIIAQLFSGVDALHSAGALHRDIKPSNITVSRAEDGTPQSMLLDLGIVSPMFEKSVTAVSRFVGSKHWAPLEQLIGETIDVRSDIYSIAAVAYNLLVGVEPFTRSATEAAVAVEMTRGGLTIPSLSNLPTEITDMLNACLSKHMNERPRNARECLALLSRHGITP